MKFIGSTTGLFLPQINISSLSKDELQFRSARFELLDSINSASGDYYGCLVENDDYLGDNKFSRHFYPTYSTELSYEVRGEVRLDSLYDKTQLCPEDIPHISDKKIVDICWNKETTNQVFGQFQPRSATANNLSDLRSKMPELKGDNNLVVIKPFEGFGGKDILVINPSDIEQYIKQLPQFPFLIQEFVESSEGVHNIASGRHDLRIIILNGNILGGSIRIPKPGGFLSNTHQGGTMRLLDISEIPDDLKDLSKDIDTKLPRVPRLYSADFIHSSLKDRWFLIELNQSPGLIPSSFGPTGRNMQAGLKCALIDMANSKHLDSAR